MSETPNDPKWHKASIWLNPKDYKEFSLFLKSERLPFAAWVRQKMKEEIKRQKKTSCQGSFLPDTSE